MYARFINEFTIIAAPLEYWGKRDFSLAANGFLPVRQAMIEPHKRSCYEVVNGEIITSNIEYTGDALAAYRRKLKDRLQTAYKAHEER